MLISICVVTYLRPQSLIRLLESINQISLPQSISCEMIVVDNDVNGSAKASIEYISKNFQHTLVYEVEPERGIAYARNKALNLSNKDSSFVLFVDDDEIVSENWVQELIKCQKETGASIVYGPTIPIFPENTKFWLKKSNVYGSNMGAQSDFNKKGHPNTSNVMLAKHVLKHSAIIFDVKPRFWGGDDTLFFLQLMKAKYRFQRTNKAINYEFIPTSRCNIKWIIDRSFRNGNTQTIAYLRTFSLGYTIGRQLLKSIFRLLRSFLHLSKSILSKRYLMLFIEDLSTALGAITGLTGWVYQGYKVIHKSDID